MTTHTVRTIPHCKAGPIMCIECMARVANDTARRLGYSEHEAVKVNDAYYEAILNTGDWRQCDVLRAHVVGICRANDLAVLAYHAYGAEEDEASHFDSSRMIENTCIAPHLEVWEQFAKLRIQGERITPWTERVVQAMRRMVGGAA